MPPDLPKHFMLRRVRQLIDHLDDGVLALVAARRRLVATAAVLKRSVGLPLFDQQREISVSMRAQRFGRHLGLEPVITDSLITVLVADAHNVQELNLNPEAADNARTMRQTSLEPIMPVPAGLSTEIGQQLLRLIPPPARLARPLGWLPDAWQRHAFELAMRRALAGPLAAGALEFLRERRLGIEVSDLGLRWVVSMHADQLLVCAHDLESEATVRGTATDLLLLVARLEDADTLFFQRRLTMTGDTELGLTARNLLDQLPWENVPLGLRIVLNRCARLARAGRATYHHECADPAPTWQ